MTPYLFGIGLALATGVYASLLGFSKERAFYPTLLIVVATYYLVFAAIGGGGWLLEALIASVFVVLAAIGFKGSAWIVVVGLAGHTLLDSIHSLVVANAGVPEWWPAFCGSYDLAAAAYLASILLRAGSTRGTRATL